MSSEGLSPLRKRARLRRKEEETTRLSSSASVAATSLLLEDTSGGVSTTSQMSQTSTPRFSMEISEEAAAEEEEEEDHQPHHDSNLVTSSFLLLARGRLDALNTTTTTTGSSPLHDPTSQEALSAAAGALEALSTSIVPSVVFMEERMPIVGAIPAEESTTDDEELQQLSMVKSESIYDPLVYSLSDDGGSAQGVELELEDVLAFLFDMAREQKTVELHNGMRTVCKARNADELLPRLVMAEDETGLTLLMIAVRGNDDVFCRMLLDAGADVNYVTEKRTYALLLAAQKGSEDITTFLLKCGANEESKNMALIPAAHFGHLPVVKMLLETGGNQNYANKKGTTPLMRAAQEGRAEVVEFLIKKGADTCAANNEGMTALMLAAQRGHANIATMLLKSGSNVNKQTRQGSTALLLAAKRGHTAAVEALMTAGADIFLKDDRDKTAADTAQRRGHVDLFLKISVQNQLRLMREDLRRQRCYTLMRLSTLYVLSRAQLTLALKNQRRQQYNVLMDRTLRLPKPLLQNIALFLPLCRMWDRQLRYLSYETVLQPNRVAQQGLRILDEVLLSVSLEVRPSLHRLKQEHGGPLHVTGLLGLLRDSFEYRGLFTTESRTPMPPRMVHQLRHMADIQGALSTYAAGSAIQFGVEVAQDVVALLTDVLKWDAARRQDELLS